MNTRIGSASAVRMLMAVLAFLPALWGGCGRRTAPPTAQEFFNRGLAKIIESDWDGAIADYTKAIELDPKYFPAYNNRGYAKQKIGDQVGADADFFQAKKLRELQQPFQPPPSTPPR